MNAPLKPRSFPLFWHWGLFRQALNVSAADIGLYSVTVANFFGTEKSETVALALTRPFNTEELAPKITGFAPVVDTKEDDSASFTAIAIGEKPLTYQWAFNGTNILSATNVTYQISQVRLEHAGVYSVVVMNQYGSDTNSAPTFGVISLPRPTNDNFANRATLSNSISNPVGTAVSIYATREPEEPVLSPTPFTGGHSVWWTWTAPQSGVAIIDDVGSTIDGVYSFAGILSIYQGTNLSTLKLVNRAFSTGYTSGKYAPSYLTIQVAQDDVFQICHDDYYGHGGYASVEVNFTPDTQSDLFPVIRTGPTATNVEAGKTFSLSVTANGTHPLYYEWRKDGVPLTNFAGASLILSNAQATDAGEYSVFVTNRNGSVLSIPATVIVSPTAPIIGSKPKSTGLTEGYPLRLSVTASGTQPLSYQWTRNGIDVIGGTNSRFIRTNSTLEDAGMYSVRVSNSEGTTNVGPVQVSIVPAPVRYLWSTLAGVAGKGGYVDGVSTNARFISPSGIAIDTDGTLLIADFVWIRKVAPDGTVSTVGPKFRRAVDVAVAHDGSLLVQEDLGTTTKVFPSGVAGWFSGGDWGVAVGLNGGIFQVGADAIYLITPDGTKTLVRKGLSFAVDATQDAKGNIFIADAGGPVIRKISADGTTMIAAGTMNRNGGSDGPGLLGLFNHPNSVSLDAQGNLFVADEFSYTIRRVSSDGVVTTVGGEFGFSGSTDGEGSAAHFSNPRRVIVAPDGVLYVVDTGNGTIRKGVPFTIDPAPPSLSAIFAGGLLELTWPMTPAGFWLEWTDSLSLNGVWTPIVNGVTTNQNRWLFSESAGATYRYYRLHNP